MAENKDRELLNACFSGDRAAWTRFVETYSKLVFYSINQTFKIMGITPDPNDVDDLYGNVFLALFENNFARLKKFKGKNNCSLASWIRLIASNKTYDHLREKSRHSRLMEAVAEHQPPDKLHEEVDPYSVESEKAEILKSAVSELSPDEIAFLHLYFERELPPERIAQILGITVSTVYSKKSRIIEKIRKVVGA